MLGLLLGRDRPEQVRTLAAIVMAMVALASLIQLSLDQSASNNQAQAQAAAIDVARRFAIALTTYDYAHPDVQKHQLQQLADPNAVHEAAAAVADIQNLEASSIGDARVASLTNLTPSSASVIVETDQVVSNDLVGRGRKLSGMLDCELYRIADRGWIVMSFQWLLAPTRDGLDQN